MNFKLVSAFIKAQRNKKQLTQAELAKYLGFHMQVISNCERAVAVFPLAHIKKLAKVFNVSPEIILNLHVNDYYRYAKKKAKL